jgi:hypothetical protein
MATTRDLLLDRGQHQRSKHRKAKGHRDYGEGINHVHPSHRQDPWLFPLRLDTLKRFRNKRPAGSTDGAKNLTRAHTRVANLRQQVSRGKRRTRVLEQWPQTE